MSLKKEFPHIVAGKLLQTTTFLAVTNRLLY
jgi:hypothetical protein